MSTSHLTPTRRLTRWVAAASATVLVTASLTAVAYSAPATSTPTVVPTDLIISEYVEGSSTNKALELFNGTDEPINLEKYVVEVSFNGRTTATGLALAGVVAPGETYLVGTASEGSALAERLDWQLPESANLWNGNDTIVLTAGETPNRVPVDSFGQRGVDPGPAWGEGETSTQNRTLRRQATVCVGDTNPNDAFDPAAEWDGFAEDDFSGLGSHTVDCGTTPPTPTPTSTTPPDCEVPTKLIGEVQGATDTSPMVGETVTVKGVVTATFAEPDGIPGFFIQGPEDSDDATSDGLFVSSTNRGYQIGETVLITARVAEEYGKTTLVEPNVTECGGADALPDPVELTLPFPEGFDLEPFEGMRVTFQQDLTISEYYNFDRFGEVVLSDGPMYQPTNQHAPGSADAQALAAFNARNRVVLDDGRYVSNPDPSRHPAGGEFALDHRFRGGDTLTGVTGVMDYAYKAFRVQPTEAAVYEEANQRPQKVAVPGDLRVASFNVLNYFTTLGERGANTTEELDRQRAKIVTAIIALDADIVGLMELENDPAAIEDLVTALNTEAGDGTFAYIDTGVVGSDAITQGILYRPAAVSPKGDLAVLTSAVDENFLDTKNRPVLAHTFVDEQTGEVLTVAVNHLKSKGSSCDDVGDPEDPNGQGNCNQVRTRAAKAMQQWLATYPTGVQTNNQLILGDLNAYAQEDPITALTAAGYVNLVAEYAGPDAYSYLFNGQRGYLDHALASPDLAKKVQGAAVWHINADEPDLLDYTMQYKKPAQQAIYAPDEYRSSDHDPIVVGINLASSQAGPQLDIDQFPPTLTGANGMWSLISAEARTTPDATVRLTDAVAFPETCHMSQWPLPNWRSHINRSVFWVTPKAGCEYTMTFTAHDANGGITTKTVTTDVTEPH